MHARINPERQRFTRPVSSLRSGNTISAALLGVEALCANFDARPPGFRLLEVADDFSYSWNFIAV